MITPERLKIRADTAIRLEYFGMFILVGYAVAFVLTNGARSRDTAVNLIVAAFAIFVGVSAWAHGRAIARGARVLNALRAPTALWRRWSRTVIIRASLRWAAVTLVTTVLLAVANGGWPWSFAPFLVSSVMILSLAAGLSHYGIWHWTWSWTIAGGALLFALFSGWSGLSKLAALPALAQLALATAWPLFAWLVAAYWQERPSIAISARRELAFAPLYFVLGQMARYTVLPIGRKNMVKLQGKLVAAQSFSFFVPTISIMLVRDSIQKAQWGSQAGLFYVATLLMIVIYASAIIVCKDLHWRRLLSPAGLPRDRIGWHIILSTWSVAAVVLAIGGVIWIVCGWFFFKIAPGEIVAVALSHSFYLLELMLATSIGVALRGTKRPAVNIVAGTTLLVIATLAGVYLFGATILRPWFVIDDIYAAILVVGIIIATTVSNRLWTIERLLPFIVSGKATNDNMGIEGRWFTWPGRRFG